MPEINFGEYDPQHRDSLVEEALRDIGHELKKLTPPGYSFIAIVAKNGEGDGCFYISSVQRESAIKLLEEMVEKLK